MQPRQTGAVDQLVARGADSDGYISRGRKFCHVCVNESRFGFGIVTIRVRLLLFRFETESGAVLRRLRPSEPLVDDRRRVADVFHFLFTSR